MAFSLREYVDNRRKNQEENSVASQENKTFSLSNYISQRRMQGSFQKQNESYNNWLDSAGSLSDRIAQEYNSRRGSYQNPEELKTYRNKTGYELGDILNQAYQSRDYYTKYKDSYDETYGKGAADKLISSLTRGIDELNGLKNTLDREYDYWSQWDSEDAYKTWQEQVAEQAEALKEREELSSFDIGAAEQQLSEIQSKLQNAQIRNNRAALGDQGGMGRFAPSSLLDRAGSMFQLPGAGRNGNRDVLDEQTGTSSMGNGVSLPDGTRLPNWYTNAAQPEEGESFRLEGVDPFDAPSANADDLREDQDDLQKQADELTRKIRLAKEIQTANKYNALMEEPDFEEYSQPVKGTQDDVYAYINNIDGFRDNIPAVPTASTKDVFEKYEKYNFMGKDEIGVYNYLYQTQSPEAAQEFLDWLSPQFGERRSLLNQAALTTLSEKAPVTMSIASIPLNMLGSATSVVDLLQQNLDGALSGREIDYNSPAQVLGQSSDIIRSDVGRQLEENTNWTIGDRNVASFLYNNAMSMADSLAASMVGGGSTAAATALLGSSVATSTARDIASRGGSDSQALVGGVAAGIFEALFERFSIGNFQALKETPVNGIKDLVKNIAKSAGVNASEEAATEMANIVFDTIAMGDVSNWEQSIKAYMEEGMSESEAKSRTVQDMFGQVIEAGAGGALMGVGFGGVGSGMSWLSNRKGNRAEPTEVSAPSDSSLSEQNQTGAAITESSLPPALQEAMTSAAETGSVSNSMAERILDDPQATDALAQSAGLNLSQGMSMSQRRNAVREVVQALAMRSETTFGTNNQVARESEKSAPMAAESVSARRTQSNAAGRLSSSAYASHINSQIQRGSALGDNGKKAFQLSIRANEEGVAADPVSFYKGFMDYYNAGVKGEKLNRVKSPAAGSLDSAQQFAAYSAGQNDAAASLAAEKTGVGRVTVYNDEAGLIENEYSAGMDDGAKSALHTEARALGMKVIIDGGINVGGRQSAGNGYLKDGVLHIAADAADAQDVVRRHEVTHRLQELAPEAYRKFRDYVMRAQENGTQAILDKQTAYSKASGGTVALSNEQAMDEIAADFAGKLLTDEAAIQKVIKDDRTLGQKIREAIRDLSQRIKEAFGKADPSLERAQKLWDDAFKAAVKQAEQNFLAPDGSSRGIMGKTRNSLKEDMENGRAREETREDFLRRSGEEVFQIFEGRHGAFGYRSVQGGYTASAGQIQEELQALGVNCDITDGSVQWNTDGITRMRQISEAVIVDGKIVLINNGVDMPARQVAGHEAFHFWKNTSARQQYTDTIQENILSKSKEFLDYQNTIMDAYFDEDVDLSNAKERSRFFEELFAYISGDIHEGVNDDSLRPMFRDFEAVKQAWEKLVRERTNPSEARYSLKDQSPEARAAKLEELNAYLRAQLRVSDGITTDQKAVEKLAKSLVKEYSTEYESGALASQLQELYDWMGNGKDKSGNELTYEGLREKALAVSRDILSGALNEESAARMDEAASYLAADLIEQFYDLPQQKPTFADKAQRKLTEQRIHDKKKLEKLRAQKNERIEAIRQQGREQVKKAIAKERERLGKQVREVKEHYQGKEAAARERRSAAELRRKITKHTAELSRKLLRPSDKQHIPDRLRGPVAAMLEAINQESQFTVDQETGKRSKNGDGLPVKRTEAFLALKEQYAKIAAEKGGDMTIDPSLLGSDAEGVEGNLDKVIAMRDTKLANMNVEQLETVWNTVKAIEKSVSTAGKILSKAKFEKTQDWAGALEQDTATRRAKNSLTGKHVMLDLEVPYTFFSHFGEAGKAIFRMLRDAQDYQQNMIDQIADAVNKIIKPKQMKALEEQTRGFTTERGDKLTLSMAQIMELYELSKRKQGFDHLTEGGIVQPEVKSAKIRRGTDAVHLTAEDISAITGTLTEEQVKIADGLQSLMTGLLADFGNEASLAAYGYRKFTEPDYWPIHAAREEVHSRTEGNPGNTRSIKNIGFAQQTVPGASNALDLSGVFSSFAGHAADMTDYAAWLLPMEDAGRLFNFRYRDGDGNYTGKTLKGLLDRVGGPGSQRYWTNLMEDIQNGIKARSDTAMDTILNKVVGNAKAAAVAANLRVVLQQPTAYLRAGVVLDPASMTQGLVKGATEGNGWKKALEYAPIARRKDRGGFEISTPLQMSEILFDDRTRLRKLNDKLAWGASKADAVTWGKIWNACEWQTVKDHSELERGSKAFYEETAKLFTEVIDQSQVVDGVLQRSQIMRSSNALHKQATSFMGEPTMALNMLMRAVDGVRYEQNASKRGKAIRTLGRSAAALLATDIVNALAQSLADALRDDDEDKKYWERFWSAFTGITGDEENVGEQLYNIYFGGNAAGNMSLLGRMPYVNDLLSLIQGYNVTRMDADVFANLIKAGQMAAESLDGNGPRTPAYAVKELASAGAKLFGIPVGNIFRDFTGVFRTGVVETGNIPLQYELEKAVYNLSHASNKGRYMDILFRALQQEDFDSYDHISRELVESGVTDGAAIESAMRSRYSKAREKDSGFSLSQKAEDLIGARKQYAPEKGTTESFGADNLNAAAYQSYVSQRSRDYREMADDLESSRIFLGMTAEERDMVMKAAYDLANKTALEDASKGQYEITTKWIASAEEAEKQGVEPYEYILFHTAYEMAESDRDADGDVIKGEAKSDHVREWLENYSGFTDDQREFLWGTVYKSDW